MTPTQIELVRASWRAVVPIAETAANIFYDKLFELDPSLRSLFPDDMSEQKKKLMQMLVHVAVSLNDLEALMPQVEELGRRHVDYGVTSSQYATVGSALLATLAAGLGDAFTADTKAAWTAAYEVLAKTMIDAAEAS